MPFRKYDRAEQVAEANRIRAEFERGLAANNKTIEEMLDDLRQFSEDCQYQGDNWDALLKQYPDLWVAVYRTEVIGVAPTQQELIKQVSGQGIRPGKVAMKFLNTNPPLLVV